MNREFSGISTENNQIYCSSIQYSSKAKHIHANVRIYKKFEILDDKSKK